MTIKVLGSIAVRSMMPLVATSLADVASLLASQMASLAGDMAALQGDIAAIQQEAAAILADILSATSIADALKLRLTQGLAGLEQAVRSAIEQITSGAALLALQQTLAGGLAGLLASVNGALADALSKITTLQGRYQAIVARIASLAARISDLQARLEALKTMLGKVTGLANLMGAATAQVFVYEGAGSSFGSEVATQVEPNIPGGTSQVFAIILAASAGANVAQLTRLFAMPS